MRKLYCLILFFAFISCEKEQLVNVYNDYIPDGAVIENRILNFSSLEDFSNAISNLNDDTDYSERMKKSSFISLSNYEERYLKSSSDDVMEEDTLVLSDCFSALLNAEREIIVQGILYKVCKHGTLLAYPKDSSVLDQISDMDNVMDIIQPVNGSVFSYSNDNPLSKFYGITGKNQIFLYDTYGLYNNEEEPVSYVNSDLKSTDPNYESFSTVTENSRTLFGKGWDFIFGFSISKKVKFSSDKAVDVKFYAQNFAVYSETGIKVKTQKKGFLGIWSKTSSDELRAGWDYLEIKESWPSMTKDLIQQAINEVQPYRDPYTQEYNYWLGVANLEFKKKTFVTIDMGVYDYKITNKDLLKLFVKGGYSWAKSHLGSSPSNPNSEAEVAGIREFSPNKPYSAVTKIGKFEKVANNTDKLTLIISNDFGFIVSLKVGINNPDANTYSPGLKGVASEYDILKSSMYGCARRGATWKGLRLNYKYN